MNTLSPITFFECERMNFNEYLNCNMKLIIIYVMTAMLLNCGKELHSLICS
jgi:hypothetical protein